MSGIDWKHVENACRRQLATRGIEDADRTADAVFFVFDQLRRNPAAVEKIALLNWRAAGWVAEGRSPARDNPRDYVDAMNPCDSRKRARIDRDERIASAKRDLLAVIG